MGDMETEDAHVVAASGGMLMEMTGNLKVIDLQWPETYGARRNPESFIPCQRRHRRSGNSTYAP